MTPTGSAATEPWLVLDLRKLAAGATAGLVAGFLVGGIGSRLAMMLLARLNPDATGLVSDDGFIIGRFTLGATAGLVLFTVALGVLGGLVYLAVRELRMGPAWFQTLGLTLGPGIVVGAALVHTEGVDFTTLQPAWLAIALFVAVPTVYAYCVMRLAERWLRADSWFRTGSRRRLLSLIAVTPVLPALPVVAPGVIGRVLYQLFAPLRTPLAKNAMRLVGRLGLAAVFVVALVDLVRDMRVLLG